VKIVSVNIEGKKHLSNIENLVRIEEPGVLFLQEIYESDVDFFAGLLGGECHFVPMSYREHYGEHIGIATFSKYPVRYESVLLNQRDETLVQYSGRSYEDRLRSQDFYVLLATVTGEDGSVFTFANTHLPVTEKGEVTEYQRDVIKTLLQALKDIPVVLVGDSNAPRGKEAFSMISSLYKDNIPATYTTSIDNTLHRAAPLD
jgi:exonuclease III